MSKTNENTSVPKLRFPNFKNEGGWEKKSLEDVTVFLKGKGISKSDIVPGGKQPCIRYGELYTHYNEIIDTTFSYTDLPEADLILSEANDVIIPSSGETQEDISTASCVLRSGIALGGDLNILRSSVNGTFLAYYLTHIKKRAIAKLAQGNAVVHLYSSQLKKLQIDIPNNISEQQKIAACLSSLDHVITAESQKLELLTAHKKGLLQNLFPRLNYDSYDEMIPVTDGDNSKKNHSPSHNQTNHSADKLPRLRFKEFEDSGEWEVKRLGDIGEFTGGGTPSRNNDSYWEGEIPWISSSDIDEESIHNIKISRFITEEALKNSATKKVPKNSILLVSRVGVGKLAVTKETICTSQDFTNFTPIKDDLLFLAYSFKNRKEKLLGFSQGMAIKGFTKNDISNMVIQIPSLMEQQKIAACLSSLDDLINNQSQKLEALKLHKKGLLQGLFPSSAL